MKNFSKTTLYKTIIKEKRNCYFISPHLDDAVFSTCNLMINLINKGINVTVVNVFTQPSPPPYTISVKKFLSVCGYKDSDLLFKARILEDAEVMKRLGAKVINLNFVDALWRRKGVKGILKTTSKIIPELDYVYPIYRISIAFGIISKNDNGIYSQISEKFEEITKSSNAKNIIFCPVAVGKHVDHLIVRDVCNKKYDQNKIVYWSDYPYVKENTVDSDFINNNVLEESEFTQLSPAKSDVINSYYSQNKVIFGSKIDHTKVIEKYFLKKEEI